MSAVAEASPPIVIPYKQRQHFKRLHQSAARWIFVVAHRRAGKTVALCNQLIRKALENKRQFPPPRYAYIGPSFAQAKDLVWGYFKHYTSVLPDVGVSEGDLQITLPNGAMINLYGGAAAYQRMRGVYFDGAVADEYPLLNPSMFGSVVRPCLSDYNGWFIASGTSNGDDHFNELRKRALKDDSWDVFSIPVNETDALSPEEVEEMRKDMTEDEFAREMMCSFEAPVEGSYYGEVMNELQLANRITGVPWDPKIPVVTWWDLGIDDEMVIVFVQRAGREYHGIDELYGTSKGLEHYAKIIREKPYAYGIHVLPQDIKARELGTGVSREEVLRDLLPGDIFVCPQHRVEDGITATRSVLHQFWWDATNCGQTILSLRNYHRGPKGKPVHNWASHGSDAVRTGAVAINHVSSYFGGAYSNVVPLTGPIRRRLKRLR